jgi:hypothetical protein
VFFFFKDIFQGNRREKVNGEADVGNKTWVFSNPMDSEPWGRQQSIIPIELITKYVANGKELKTQVKSLVDLAAQGCLWTRHPSYGLMRGPAFKKALLEAIKANKDDPNVCHTWKFAEGAYKPPGSNKYTGEKLKEGKIDSCSVISFGGLFVLAEPIRAEDVQGNKVRILPRFRMRNIDDSTVGPAALVMPHPDNLQEIDEVVADLHMLVSESIQNHGPLMKQDVDNYANHVFAGNGDVHVDVSGALPKAYPALLRSFPDTGVLRKEGIEFFPSRGEWITDKMKKVMQDEIESKLAEDGGAQEGHTRTWGKSTYESMYNLAYNFANDIAKVMKLPSRYGSSDEVYALGGSTFAKPAEVLCTKAGTAMQCGHADGYIQLATDDVPWVSMLMPISDIAYLRYWAHSHMLTESIRHFSYNHEEGKEHLYHPNNEELIMDMIVEDLDKKNSKLRNAIPYGTLMLGRFESIIFLPSWMHAGTCLPPSTGSINYRLHAYLIRPNKRFDADKTSLSHKMYEKYLEGFLGFDNDLRNYIEDTCVCGVCQ